MTNLIPAQFQGVDLNIIDHDGRKWLTAEQVGLALGYNPANARQGILKLYRAHADEFSEHDKGVVEMATPGGPQSVTVFSATGCHLLSFFANTSRAKTFRAWAKQVLAGEAPPPALAPTAAAPDGMEAVLTRLDRLENATVTMAHGMAQLVQVSSQQAQKLDVTARYIGLLEINQKGRVRVTRTVEAQVLALRAQGMAQSDIARLLRISPTAVNQLVHGKYPWSMSQAVLPPVSIEQVLEGMLGKEREALLEKLQPPSAPENDDAAKTGR